MKYTHTKSLLAAGVLMAFAPSMPGQVQIADNLLVDLDATLLATGTAATWTNAGSAGGYFEVTNAVNTPKVIIVGGNGTAGMRFDGNDYMQHVSAPGVWQLAPTGVVGQNATASIEAWVFNVTIPDEETIVAWGRRGGPEGSNMSFNYGANGAFGAVGHWGGSDLGWNNNGGAPVAGAWHHLVYTFDGNTTRVYSDGALTNSETIGGSVINIHTDTPITLAAQLASATAVEGGLRGSLVLGKLRVHDGVLSDAQIAANYTLERTNFNRGTPTPLISGPIHRWTFNNPAGNASNAVVEDVVGNADGVVLTGGDAVTFNGTQLVLSGGSSATAPYVDLPNGLLSSQSADNGGSGLVSIEGWVTIRASRSWARIFDFGSTTIGEITGPGGTGNGGDYLFLSGQIGGDLNNRRVEISNNDTNGGGIAGANTFDYGSRSLGQQLHFVLTWNESTGEVLVYENGIEVASGFTDKRLSNINDVNVWLGRSNWTADNNIQADFDDFRIYNRILSPSEVLQGFLAGADSVYLEPGPLQSITIEVPRLQMTLGTYQNATVRAHYLNVSNVIVTAAPDTTFSSLDTNILTVSPAGVIFAAGAGSTFITAVHDGKSNSVGIVVNPVSATLTHRYSFDTDVSDSIGTAHGWLSNNAVVVNGQLQLNAAQQQFARLPAGIIAGYEALTVEAWASFGANSGWTRLFDFGDTNPSSGVGRNYLFFSPHTGPGDTRISMSDADPGYNHEEVVIRAGVLDGQTNVHIVTIFNPQARTTGFYINGVLAGIRRDATIQISSITDVLNYIGKSLYNADAYLTASVDEFRIYNGVLTPDKIAVNAAAGPNSFVATTGPLQSLQLVANPDMSLDGEQQLTVFANFANVANVNLASFAGVTFASSNTNFVRVDVAGRAYAAGTGAATITASYEGLQATAEITVAPLPLLARHRWSFNEIAGATTAEDSIGGAAGTLTGGAAFDDLGHVVLDGTNGFVDLPNGIISRLTNLTLEAWFTPRTGRQWERLFDFGNSTGGEGTQGDGDSYMFLAPRGAAGPRFTIKPSGGGENPILEPVGHLTIGQETHIVLVYNASGGVARLYINGELKASGPITTPLSALNDINNWLGKSQFTVDPWFGGEINEFRIYEGAMVASQVASSYTAGPDAAVGIKLQISRASNGSLVISWPASAASYFLEMSPTLAPTPAWDIVSETPVESGGFMTVTLPASGSMGFFRLSQ